MVMREMAAPRDTFVLMRGSYEKPGEKVTPASLRSCRRCPPALPPIAWAWLAGWWIPRNPLTARVAVNRYWQTYFGTGLVKTAGGFRFTGRGAQPPRTAGLAGHRIRPHRLGREGDAAADRHLRDLSPDVESPAPRCASAIRRIGCSRAVHACA